MCRQDHETKQVLAFRKEIVLGGWEVGGKIKEAGFAGGGSLKDFGWKASR